MKKATDNVTCKDWLLWLKLFKKNKPDLSAEECLAISNAVITYERVAEMFFYDTLSPMWSGLAFKIKDSYVKEGNTTTDDIATWVYAAMYEEGKWTRLKAYRGERSLFGWISACASQVVYKVLVDEHFLVVSSTRTAKNTSLTLKSMKYVDEVKMVIDLVETPVLHELLAYIYVYRMTDEEIMEKMQMTSELYKKSVKLAETILKDTLIAKETLLVEREDEKGTKIVNLVTLALGDVGGELNTTSSDEAMKIAEKVCADGGCPEYLRDILDEYYPTLPFMEQWMSFVLDRVSEIPLTEEERVVFIERFYNRTSPVEVAKRLDRPRTWVDNRYSQINKTVVKYIKDWLVRYGS